MCKKEETRTLFSLFNHFTCLNCHKRIKDETIRIGKNVINIYHVNQLCYEQETEVSYYFNKRLKQLLYEVILSQNTLVLWVEEMACLEKHSMVMDLLFEINPQIHLIMY